MLTVREAAEYFGIGEHKLRDLLDKNPEKNLSVWNGNRQLIRRKRLEEYLDDCDSILKVKRNLQKTRKNSTLHK